MSINFVHLPPVHLPPVPSKSELDKSVVMGGVPSTVTNESIFRIPVPAKISCYVPEKTWQNQSRVTSLHLIG